MRLMDLGIADSAVQQGLKQLQKKIVNAGKKLARSGPRPVVTGDQMLDACGCYQMNSYPCSFLYMLSH